MYYASIKWFLKQINVLQNEAFKNSELFEVWKWCFYLPPILLSVLFSGETSVEEQAPTAGAEQMEPVPM